MEIKVLNLKGEEGKSLKLPESVFGVKPVPTLIHEVVVATLANRRRGTAETLTRGQVTGGGKKPWKQKHTGRARAGTIRSPLWRKGGIIFGPHNRSYRQYLPKAKRHAALAQALSARAAEGAVSVVDGFSIAEARTKSLTAVLNALKLPFKSLVVLDAPDAKVAKAGRNVEGLTLAQVGDINAYAVLKCKHLVLTEKAVEALRKSYSHD